MAENSYDCVSSNLLLCTETKSLCFDDLDLFAIDEQTVQENSKVLSFGYGRSQALIGLLPCLSDESFGFMVEREKDFLPRDDYLKRLRSGDLDLSVRREAIDWIWKAHVHYGFGELSFCLSINYLDRFLSLYDLPKGKTWTVQLLAVACLSLAAKMEEINVPLTINLQVGEPKFVFEGKRIQRMELLVLSTLKWRMQAYTPCTFIDYFVRKMHIDEIQSRPLISRSMQLILNTIKGIDFLEFRPSEIAAAVAMCVSGGKNEMQQAKDIDKEGRVMKCLELIQDLTLVSGTSVATTTASSAAAVVATSASSVLLPQSPNGVLEAACLSYNKSDERTTTSSSCPNSTTASSHTTTSPNPNPKRRKLETSSSLERT